MTILWNLWKLGNAVIFEGQQPDPLVAIRLAENMMSKYALIGVGNVIGKYSDQIWKPPRQDWIKVDVDRAALFKWLSCRHWVSGKGSYWSGYTETNVSKSNKILLQQSKLSKEENKGMWKKIVAGAQSPWNMIANRRATNVSSAVDSILLRSLKEHYLEASKMTPPPKVSPPSPFSIVKGALESNGPVLRRTYDDEEISISVMRLANIIPGGGDDDEEDDINQLFLHVDVSKPGREKSLHFLCGLYPDAMGIHSVSLRPKVQSSGFLVVPSQYSGPTFQDLKDRMRDALHTYIEVRGVNASLFPFLQAWLYVKDHRNLMGWFKTVGTFVNEHKTA
ncbi:hypothetical protein HHK36_016924 [Tetracentron sinense]|uniref:Mitochondrial glycoprotein n=1 Tax=Tetracentron sinense TaxID=13715 RepID=A0A835DBE1_TETSI|nr:hypothetical protein HHK36_016924 [Tetracentron sinense]